MHRFWDSVTRPLLEIIRPHSIAEIGVYKGEQTVALLKFARDHDAVVHAIDPEVHFPLQDFERDFGRHFHFHQSTSLDALANMSACDVYLIDGDHNWYTVLHELHAIGKTALSRGKHPVVLLHDTEWPYGRRDQYCNPEHIPQSECRSTGHGGVVPEQIGLFPDGINANFSHAMQEGGEHNGVLTAIEQYLSESPASLSFVRVHGLHGLGILFPKELEKENAGLQAFIASLHPTYPLQEHIKALEINRLTILRDCAMLIHAHDDVQRRFSVAVRTLMNTTSALDHAVPGSVQPGPSASALLRETTEERDTSVAALQHIQHSRSWRMTAPLRRLEYMLRHFSVRNMPRMMMNDVHTLWVSMGSPLPQAARFIRHRLLRSVIPIRVIEVPASPPTMSVTVALRWDDADEPASIRSLESILRQSSPAKDILVMGNHADASQEFNGQNPAYAAVRWIDASQHHWISAAAEACTEDMVVLMEPGTVLHPAYLKCGMESLRTHSTAGIAYTDWHAYDTRDNHQAPAIWNASFDNADHLHLSSMVRREAFTQAVKAGSTSWDGIRTAILAQGWTPVKSAGTIFFAKRPDNAREEKPYATLCLALSGRAWMWEETRAFLERQTYPHERTHLIVLDTSQNETFGLQVRLWLSRCTYAHQTYIRETVGQKSLADLPREEVTQSMSDACASIYNLFARRTHTPIVFTLEDDVIPPDDAFVRLSRTLLEQHAATVSGSYRHRLEPRLIAWNWAHDERPTDIVGVGEGIELVGGTGFGCMAIDGAVFARTVFQSGPPWRNFDTNFFRNLVCIEGGKTFVDWGCPCRHYVHANHWVSPA